MKFRDLAYEIVTALKANKGRSALTILGIVIGIAAVVMLTSLIAGMKNQLLSEVGADQARLISYGSYMSPITTDDLDYLRQKVTDYEFIGTAQSFTNLEVSSRSKSETFSISRVTPGVLARNSQQFKLYKGRYFAEADSTAQRQVAILDADVTKAIFGTEEADVVGQTIKVGPDSFQIIGTLQKTGSLNSMGSGGTVYIPEGTAFKRMGADPDAYSFLAYVKEGVDPEKTKNDTIKILTQRIKSRTGDIETVDEGPNKGQSPVMGYTQKDMVQLVESVTGVFSAILGSVASISLVVGGIGIMNMMLTNVQERIREIGLRKSIGAKPRDIINQFLGESIVLCLIGGILGLLFGYLGALAAAQIIGLASPDLKVTPVVTPGIALIAFGVSAAIGVIFGWSPARRAARLDPVESLRNQ